MTHCGVSAIMCLIKMLNCLVDDMKNSVILKCKLVKYFKKHSKLPVGEIGLRVSINQPLEKTI